MAKEESKQENEIFWRFKRKVESKVTLEVMPPNDY